FWAGSAGILDVTRPEAVQWMWPFYQKQLDLGVAGFWCDSGEPENHPLGMRHALGTAEEVHNLYSNLWARDLYRSFRKRDSVNRWFNLIRSGYAGMQRYATFPWSGDVSRTWEAFRAQPMIMLGAGLSGIGYMHSDLGGFTGGPRDPELFQRWLQMGSFVPIMRVHGDATGFAPEPVFFDEKTQEIALKAINLRYQLLPYNYTLAWENHQTGAPLVRPMWFHFPEDSVCARLDDQYLWGENLLVAPIFKKGATSRKIYFPHGCWYDLYSGEKLIGNGWQEVEVTSEQIPVFVKGGSIIPIGNILSNTAEDDPARWALHVYPDENMNATGQRYLDDGQTVGSANNNFLLSRARFFVEGKKGALVFETEGPGYPQMPTEQVIDMIVHDPNDQIAKSNCLRVSESEQWKQKTWIGRLIWEGKTVRKRWKARPQD
ncbi:MAG: TIM-barrel domain-containing protein, partial [Bacteroidota bacterium]